MRHTIFLFIFTGSMAAGVACSSSTSTDDGGTSDAANPNDSSSNKDGTTPTDGSTPTDGTTPTDAGDAGSTFTLTINDYLNWCAVSVNNGQSSTSTPQTFQFAPNTVVNLHGDTASAQSFYWGYWQGAGVGDGGKDTSMDASVTMTGDQTVLACCPDLNTPLSCP